MRLAWDRSGADWFAAVPHLWGRRLAWSSPALLEQLLYDQQPIDGNVRRIGNSVR